MFESWPMVHWLTAILGLIAVTAVRVSWQTYLSINDTLIGGWFISLPALQWYLTLGTPLTLNEVGII